MNSLNYRYFFYHLLRLAFGFSTGLSCIKTYVKINGRNGKNTWIYQGGYICNMNNHAD